MYDSSEPSDSEQSEEKPVHRNGPVKSSNDAEEDLNDCKLQTLKELFPQKNDQELLKVE